MIEYPQLDSALIKQMEEQFKHDNKILKDMFSGEIKGSFLIKIMGQVLYYIGPVILLIYDVDISDRSILKGVDAMYQYELCKMIVGVHHSNTVFLSESERAQKEKDPEYNNKIVRQVTENMVLRRYAGAFFRRKDFIKKERYIYYSVPYILFAMCTRMNELFISNKTTDACGYWSALIVAKALAALTLLEDSFLDSAYMPCRAVIELFMKLMLVKKNPQIFEEETRFANYELEKTCVSHRYTEEFNESFANRKNSSFVNKIDYLHYRFVDAIDDYHEIVRQSPYSISGIVRYLEEKADEESEGLFYSLEHMYKMCHGYTHGNVITARYPLLNYFEISLILVKIIPRIYSMVCDSYGVDSKIHDVKMMERIEEECSLLQEQYNKRSLELFELEEAKLRQ